MRLSGAPRPELNGVVVADYERHHASDQDVLLTRIQAAWLETDTSYQQFPPLHKSESRTTVDERRQGVTSRHLDRADGFDPERLTTLLGCECGDVLQGDLSEEA